MNTILLLFLLLITKHFIVDFPLQNKFQWSNKGTYGHAGGILHASLHGIGTMLCFWFYAPLACVWLGLIDALVHYHIDWAKMNLNAKLDLRPDNSEKFWWLLGLDQYLHYLTYILLIGLVV